MQIIVSDTSCIVDLKRVELLAAIFELPFQFVIPAPLLDYELLTLSSLEKQLMMDLGLTVLDLDSSAMKIAYDHNAQNAALSVYDWSCPHSRPNYSRCHIYSLEILLYAESRKNYKLRHMALSGRSITYFREIVAQKIKR